MAAAFWQVLVCNKIVFLLLESYQEMQKIFAYVSRCWFSPLEGQLIYLLT